jgi:hypothetical protein
VLRHELRFVGSQEKTPPVAKQGAFCFVSETALTR